MSQKSVKFHIKSGDYFGTLASVLSLIKELGDKGNLKLFKKIISDLMFLQKNYIIIKK